jgi:hypothetical protein
MRKLSKMEGFFYSQIYSIEEAVMVGLSKKKNHSRLGRTAC